MAIKNTLAELFGNSPIRPLQEHMEVSASAADELELLFKSVFKEDWTKAEGIYQNICSIEHTADKLKKELRLHLPKNLFLPVPRGDVLDLLSKQNAIANTAKDIAGIVSGRKMALPEALHQGFLAFVQVAIANVHQALSAIEELDALLETGFRGREATVVEKQIDELGQLEQKADVMARALRAQLFDIEASLSPLDAMFMYRIIDGVSSLADQSEKVGSCLLLLVAH